VFGSSGFIGSHLVNAMKIRGFQVNCPARQEIQTIAGNLGHVFYALGVDNVAENPVAAVDAHVLHLRRVLNACEFESLTYFSSTRLYMGASSGAEDAVLAMNLADAGLLYNATKLTGELLCLSIERRNVRVVRISNVLGVSPRGINLVPVLIRDALTKKIMMLSITRTSSKDYVALEDVLDLIPKIALFGNRRIYNVASGANTTIEDIVACIERCTGARAEWRNNSPEIIFPKLDINRVRVEFDFKPRPPIEGLPLLCNAYRDHLA
jgi:nucleoside-diphosphate-sugar epimerase